MRDPVKRARAFPKQDSGVAFVEFAMIAPFLLFLMLAGFEMGRYVLATQRVAAVANSVAQMLGQTGPSAYAVNSNDGAVTDSELTYFQQSAFFTYPDVLLAANQQGVAWTSLLVVNMASVRFNPKPSACTSNCQYQPQVVWSTGWRSCTNPISQVPNDSAPSASTLPVGIYGPNSQIVVDVQYTFTPAIGAAFLPTMSIVRSVYLSPRNVTIVESYKSALAPTCAGSLP